MHLSVKGPLAEVQAAIAGSPRCKRPCKGWGDGIFLEADLDKEVRPELARCIVQRGWDLLELKTREFTLEDVFINLVTEEEQADAASSVSTKVQNNFGE